MPESKQNITFEEEDIYVDIDVHKSSWTIAICTEHRCSRPFTISPPRVEDLVDYLENNFPDCCYLCAYEAGFSGFNLCEALFDYGIACLVVHAADIPTADKETEFKTDARDAAKIARSLRSGELRSIHIPSTVPGIGRLTAIKFMLQLGDIRRFRSLDALCNYVGLVPASHNSGNRVRQGRLTHRGHTQLRTMLVEAAWTAIGVDPALSHCYTELKKRMLPQKAIVRITKKLLARIRYVLKNKVPYEKGVLA